MKRKDIQRIAIQILVFVLISCSALAQTNTPLRRPVSPHQPMWLIHIDTWNYADPQKIIDLIPKDIRPYVVMNISLSVSHNSTTGQFTIVEYGFETAKSWLRTCAENRMWAVIQPSSGAYSRLPDNDMTIYEDLFNTYPNLIGFNYAEQSWGYGDSDPLAISWEDRISHFTKLLELSDKYGGYLVVSWCGNKYIPNINPIAMVKRNATFATACAKYTKNYILSEKYTFKSYQSDMESLCLGAYLSGYSGNYALRYDDSGWTDKDGNVNQNFTMATSGAPFLEHVMLTGQTVIDGPELIWTHCFKEVNAVSTTDGYFTRNWETFPQFDKVSVDLFRKVLDGTVRIPNRQEVIDRTKVVIINNVSAGSSDDIYSSPASLFEGLYRMDGDGNLGENFNFFKKTGRYPTIPTVYQLVDETANSFQAKINKSIYSSLWPTVSAKVNDLNALFPVEYSGDLYAGRHENGWVTYNPFKTGQAASASIPFKYNTCDRMELNYSQYTAGVIKEYSDYLTIYLSNFDDILNSGLKTNVIKIYGSTSEPTYTLTERADNQKSEVGKDWSGGIFTLTINHNGPVDIRLNCSGIAMGRLTEFQNANINTPVSPDAYIGPRQYEAETFDYKNIFGVIKNGASENIRNYTGQGYIQFGTSSTASVRDYISVLNAGTYTLETRYAVTGADINTIDLYVNGAKVATPLFTQTTTLSNWVVNSQSVVLVEGVNVVEYKANATLPQSLYFDNIVVNPGSNGGTAFNQSPLAYAGLDKTIINSNKSGVETIALESFGSIDLDGSIQSYVWIEGGSQIATGVNPILNLSVGEHVITLTVTDNEGATDSDNVTITIFEWDYGISDIWLEAECALVGSSWNVLNDPQASKDYYIATINGLGNISTAPATDDGLVKFNFSLVSEASYSVYGRIYCPTYDDDSFFLKMDNGSFSTHNGLAGSASSGWTWYKFGDFNLTEGEHTLTIGYREDGAKLDKVYVTKFSNLPEGFGSEATNCGSVGVNEVEKVNCKLLDNYPNPFTNSTTITYRINLSGNVCLRVFDVNGRIVETLVNQYQVSGDYDVIWKPKGLSGGIFFYSLQTGDFIATKKMIFQK